MAAKRKPVKWQKIREYKNRRNFSGEGSPYWNYINRNRSAQSNAGDHSVEHFEHPLGNPDIVAEPEPVKENLTRKILIDAVKHIKFSKREREVLVEICQGKTQEEVAKRLNISRSRVAQILIRIRKKGEKAHGNILANNSLLNEADDD